MKETFLSVECHVTQPIRDLGFEPRLLHMTWLIRPPLSPAELIPHIIGGVPDFSQTLVLAFSSPRMYCRILGLSTTSLKIIKLPVRTASQ